MREINWTDVAREAIRGIALDPIQPHDADEVAMFQAIVRSMADNPEAVATVAEHIKADHERAIRALLYGDDSE